MLPRWAYGLLIFLAVLLHFLLGYSVERDQTAFVLGAFGMLWFVFLIQWADQRIGVKEIIAVGMLLRLVYLMAIPGLSDDVFRYLWDGSMTLFGESPYQYTPLALEGMIKPRPFFNLIPLMNSPEYYSVYPPVLQSIFAASVWLGDGEILSSIIALRVFVLLTELGAMLLIWKLLQAWRLNTRNLMLYALNPLVIIEFAGNLHGEVFMVFFLLLSLWLLTSPSPSKGGESASKGFLWFGASAVVFGLSVGTKLLPLMFLPFYIKRLGWWKTAVYGGVAILVVGLMFIPFWTPNLVTNVSTSLKLYFASFEFNASLYYVVREVGFWKAGYNIIGQTAVWLPRIVLLIILLIALLNKNREVRGLPKLMLFAWFVYYAFATTVHPWYVAVLAAFLPFVKYRFALVWLMLVPLSYHAYGGSEFHENGWILAIEYVPVYLWLGFELGLFRPLERWWALRRAEVKRKRLLPFLTKGESVLEVGSGNGALVKLLSNEGMKLSALDIEDKSLFVDVNVRVYGGEKFPFSDKQFDVCQLITMLHHTTNAEELIREARRVSGRVIIMEDIYENPLQKYITWFTDSLVNWEFYGHPHTNRTDAEWKELFERNGFAVEKVEYYRFLLFFKQVTYVLKPQT